ncbi:CYIR protein, partial [Plasmodium cynomolgi strain B]
LSQAGDSERDNYCNYIRYWLFEQISVIYTSESTNIDDESFFKKLIDAWKVISTARLSGKCNPGNIKGVKLNELKNRIF